jgi:Esterase PHB depolymerase
MLGRAASGRTNAPYGPPTIDGVAEAARPAADPVANARPAFGAGIGQQPSDSAESTRPPTGPTARHRWIDPARHNRLPSPGGGLGQLRPRPAPGAVPDGAKFLTATFSGTAGNRPDKLYVPSSYKRQPVPLIVMLHGCTQSPDDFAAGTRMNEAAEQHTCLVAYPEQTGSANMQKCWNWFREANQGNGAGKSRGPRLPGKSSCRRSSSIGMRSPTSFGRVSAIPLAGASTLKISKTPQPQPWQNTAPPRER